MPEHLCISVRFLDGTFHGRADYGEPEWPPSPLRLFQALTNAAAAGNEKIPDNAVAALHWFEQLPPPEILADQATPTSGYQLYVPDNIGDLVAKQWSAGKYFDNKNHPIDISSYRAGKRVRPLRLSDSATVHYLWTLDATADFVKHSKTLLAVVRSVSRLGWGIDLVVADASILNETDTTVLKGQRYFPTDEGADYPLRVPQAGTLDDLENRHKAFLNRVSGDDFTPVPPLAVYDIANYRLENERPRPLCAVFALRQLDDNGFRPFNTARRGLHVAGMLRHIANDSDFSRSIGWSEKEIRQMVQGHGEERGQQHQPVQGARLAFLPLPSIEFRGDEKKVVGSIRRVAVTAFSAFDRELFRRFTRQLDGRELKEEDKTGKKTNPIALLARQPQPENVGAIKAYFQSAATWATVTPVILPGYDDPRKLRRRMRPGESNNLTADGKKSLLLKLDKRIEFLLRKAIRQAGFSDALAQYAELEWRSTGFWPGTELASRYIVPDQHRRYRRLHVRITWRSPAGNSIEIPGPICIGGGKFSGFGLFAPISTA